MNIEGISMAMAQSNSLSNVGTAILAKTLDSAQQSGQQLVKMMDGAALERSINPHVGSNFDMVV